MMRKAVEGNRPTVQPIALAVPTHFTIRDEMALYLTLAKEWRKLFSGSADALVRIGNTKVENPRRNAPQKS